MSDQPPQHLVALEQANRIRFFRADLKRKVHAGASAIPIVNDPPEQVGGMTIGELLRAQPGWGRHRARKFLVVLGIAENRPLRRMTVRQREAVAEGLEDAYQRRDSDAQKRKLARERERRRRQREQAA